VADREWAESLGLGERLELHPYMARRNALALQRDSEALLLLIPDAGGRGQGVLSGKVFEYLAAERPILAAVPPDGAAAELIRETGAGVVASPEDVEGLKDALLNLHARWQAGTLDGTRLSSDDREQLGRAARVEELAEVLRSLAR
jgi:glycosyltransferase involved in cell wall biosynthesis